MVEQYRGLDKHVEKEDDRLLTTQRVRARA